VVQRHPTPRPRRMEMPLLETIGVTKRFGGLVAVAEVDFSIEEGTICSIIGPNGAGKTTFFNTLTGIYHPDEGRILFEGKSLVGLRPDQVNARALARTFQNIRLFNGMTVSENIRVGMHNRLGQTMLGALLRTRAFSAEENRAQEEAHKLMNYVGLQGFGDELASNLPYGAQRRVEIARALASEPKLLLLDEPTAGMNPNESREAMLLFQRLRDDLGVTILLIEHDMRVVMTISDRITVMDYGQKIAEGLPAEIRSNTRVIEAYLGRGAAVENIMSG
jgi:branched-chain amino acid transport system ATP-binding protein